MNGSLPCVLGPCTFCVPLFASHSPLPIPIIRPSIPSIIKMPATVKAVDLAPKAFANGGGATVEADKPDDLQYDLHHLTALDAHPVSESVPQGLLLGYRMGWNDGMRWDDARMSNTQRHASMPNTRGGGKPVRALTMMCVHPSTGTAGGPGQIQGGP